METVDVEIASAQEKKTVSGVAGPLIVIGRADGSSVVLKHDDVSRKHASVEVGDGGLVVRDLSTNGTFVDGKRVMGALKLPFGKPIQVGPFTLRIRPAGAPAAVRAVAGGIDARQHQNAAADAAPAAGTEQPLVVAEGAVVVERAEFKGESPPPPRKPVAVARAPQMTTPARPAPLAAAREAAVNGGGRAATPAHGGPAQPGAGAAAQPAAAAAASPGGAKGAFDPYRDLPQAPPDLSDQERDRLKRWLRGLLLEALDLPSLRPEELQDKALAPRVLQLMDELLDEHARELPKGLDRGRLRKELADEVLGLGPLEDLLADSSVSEVMVVDRATIYIERRGKLELTGARFSSEDALRSAIERIVTPLGRRIDESTPMVDARLKDGSRVNAIIPPLALRGPCLTIRKFSQKKLTLDDLIGYGSLDDRMARFLTRAVISRRNIVVSGGTGSGKTTLLNVLSNAIPEDERIVTIEDAAELRLSQPHVVSLETRPPNMEGRGEYSIRDLVKNSLRMRPDRIVVGECRGGEALDMLQAMNTGHDGSLTTTHANSPEEAIARLETLVLMSGLELPARAIREQIANSIHLVVQQARFVDGTRKVTSVAEVVGIEDDGVVRLENIFEFHRMPGDRGKVRGEFRATGYMPSFIQEFITMGLVGDGEYL
jgi:pilus assembly protein CpaF